MSAPSRRSRSRSRTRWHAAHAARPAASAHQAGPLFYQPTLLADVPDDALIMREETFGPVAAVTPFDTEDEVIARANDTEYGLVAYVVTENGARQLRMGRALEYGMVAINRVKITGAPVPFGGVKQSGLGREGSRHGLEAFTELKYLCLDCRLRRRQGDTAMTRPLQRTQRLGPRPLLPSLDPYGHACARRERRTGSSPAAKGSTSPTRRPQAASTPLPGSIASMSAMAGRRSPTPSPRRPRSLAYYHAYAGHGTDASIRLAKMIIDRAPEGMSRVYFGLSGSDANETNIKLIWYYNNVLGRPEKKKIISRWRGYHGSGVMTGSLTGLELFHNAFDLPRAPILHTEAPYYFRRADRSHVGGAVLAILRRQAGGDDPRRRAGDGRRLHRRAGARAPAASCRRPPATGRRSRRCWTNMTCCWSPTRS